MAARKLEGLGPCVPNPPPPPHKQFVPGPPPPPPPPPSSHVLAPPLPHTQYVFPMPPPPQPPSNSMSPWAVVALVLLGLLVIFVALAAVTRRCLTARRQRHEAAAADEAAMRRPGSFPGELRRSELRSATPPPYLKRYVLPGTSGSAKNPPPSNSRQPGRSMKDMFVIWIQRD